MDTDSEPLHLEYGTAVLETRTGREAAVGYNPPPFDFIQFVRAAAQGVAITTNNCFDAFNPKLLSTGHTTAPSFGTP